jgi:predicted PurR-regulated permease PerM
MNEPNPVQLDKAFLNRALETTIRVGLVAALVIFCFQILRPFLSLIIWGIIIAIAIFPAYRRLTAWLGERRKIAATLFIAAALVVLIIPTIMLSQTLITGVRGLSQNLQDGSLTIPPPSERVGSWPLIGEPIERLWRLASENIGEALDEIGPQLKTLSKWLLTMAAGAMVGILQFVVAILIAGVLMVNAASGKQASQAIARRLAGERGAELADLAETTVRSVARGILGVAIIQSLLAGLGFMVVGVPGAGLWALLCMFCAIIQIGVLPITLPIVIYVFATASTGTAVAFLIWSLFVGVIDNVLKPLLLGRGMTVPMVVIFLGSIGGFLASGIIGLFVGAVVLVLGYELFHEWLRQEGELPLEDSHTESKG